MEVKELNANQIAEAGVLGQMFNLEHEQVLFCQDKEIGLKAIIAVHNTVCGPALSKCPGSYSRYTGLHILVGRVCRSR